MGSRRVTGQSVIALLVVAVGLILLGRTTGFYDVSPALDFIPSLFVLAGLCALWASGFRNVTGAVLVIVVAGAWQFVTLDLVEAEMGVSLWPLLIVLFGLSVLFGQYRARSHAHEIVEDHPTARAFFGGSD